MALLAQTLALLAVTVATMGIEGVTLDMAQDSFDDQYQDCGPAMAEALTLFAQAWTKAKAEWHKRGSPVSPLASPAHAIALMAFTMDDLYREFNAAVRTAGRSSQEYRDNFHFKTLHFLLTQALATLRVARGPQCHDMYWGVSRYQFKAKPGDIVRFGQFMSVSKNETTDKIFGNGTVFQVHTCNGVGIQQFSKYPDEKKVVISPFEIFEVIEVWQEAADRTRIQLLTNGTFSRYNCEWLHGDTTGDSLGRWGHPLWPIRRHRDNDTRWAWGTGTETPSVFVGIGAPTAGNKDRGTLCWGPSLGVVRNQVLGIL
uniref:NAD(P)(+)--arginine ADP-ribosyltransferase n=1 Tax=Geospiza parvula TaxID=87175 RepID=A0A8C3MBU6_GEOPR